MTEITSVSGARDFYDRIAPLYAAAYRLAGYDASLARFLRRLALPFPDNPRVLDAGCGTGLVELAMLGALPGPLRLTAVDISRASVLRARQAVRARHGARGRTVSFSQGNVLSLPFREGTFDVLVTCGVLEYVPVAQGLAELARVVKPGGWLLHLPVRPSVVGRLLERVYRFRTLEPGAVLRETERWFTTVGVERFPGHEPIAWSKLAIVAQRRAGGGAPASGPVSAGR